MEFLKWFFGKFKSKPKITECFDCQVPVKEPVINDRFETLRNLAITLGVVEATEEMVVHCMSRDKDPRYWAVFDAAKHSSTKRLHVFDTELGIAKSYYVAHGSGSDPSHTGYIKRFSNTDGSHCTSKGLYLCSETYISGKFGKALRLDGLSPSNSNARDRAVVFHGSTYAEDAYVKLMGKCGRSQGCTAVGFAYSDELIELLKNGSLLNVWAK